MNDAVDANGHSKCPPPSALQRRVGRLDRQIPAKSSHPDCKLTVRKPIFRHFRDLKLERIKRFKSRPTSPNPELVLLVNRVTNVAPGTTTRIDLYNNKKLPPPSEPTDIVTQITKLEEAETLWNRLKQNMRRSHQLPSQLKFRLECGENSARKPQSLATSFQDSFSSAGKAVCSFPLHLSRPKSRGGTDLKYISAREKDPSAGLMNIVLAVKADLDNTCAFQRRRADTYLAPKPADVLGKTTRESGRKNCGAKTKTKGTKNVTINLDSDPPLQAPKAKRNVVSLKLRAENAVQGESKATFEKTSLVSSKLNETKRFNKENAGSRSRIGVHKNIIQQNYKLGASIVKSKSTKSGLCFGGGCLNCDNTE